MAVALRGSSTTGSSDILTSIATVPKPTSPSVLVNGDIVVVALELWETGNPTVSNTHGFTQFADIVSGSQKLKLFWKRITSAVGEPANWLFTWTGSQWNMGHAVSVSGGKSTGDPVTVFDDATGTGTAIPTASVSPGFAPGLIASVANETAAAQTPPTSFTELHDGDYLHTSYRIPGSSGTYTTAGGSLTASGLQLVVLTAVEPAGGGSISESMDTATETDTALTLPRSKRRSAALTSEADTARPVAKSKQRTANLAAETDTSVAFVKRKRKTVGLATSTEVALPVGAVTGRAVNTASETDSALSFARSKRKAIGIAVETDAALVIESDQVIILPIGTAVELDSASLLGKRYARALGIAIESAEARPFGLVRSLWRLVMPQIAERYALPNTRGSLLTTLYREATVFGDESGLFTVEMGRPGPGLDEYGAIPFGTRYIWYGGHVNTTDDPAIKNLWLAHGFEVENVQL